MPLSCLYTYQLRLKQTYAFLVQRVCHTRGSQRHEQTRNNRHKMQWGICQKTLSNRGYFQRHINNHHALKPQACLKCNARHVYKSSLLRHTMSCGYMDFKVIFAKKDLQERMAFKITSMVNTIAMRGIYALTAKHAFSRDRHEIDIWSQIV